MDNNLLSGTIPKEIGLLSSVRDIRIRNNLLSGTIPDEIGNMAKLISLMLNNNQLTGNVNPQLLKLDDRFGIQMEYLFFNYNLLNRKYDSSFDVMCIYVKCDFTQNNHLSDGKGSNYSISSLMTNIFYIIIGTSILYLLIKKCCFYKDDEKTTKQYQHFIDEEIIN